jgi:uroporphyrin-III C-methyltransferase / precorrin-2 dehydrogenase / sirohydrochlorin ferrochelatase
MASSDQAGLYPLFLKLAGRAVLVVGAGPVAESKIASLLAAGARVRVVAPTATEGVRQLAREGTIEWREGRFEDGDADGAWLMVAATSDPQAQRLASVAAQSRRIFVVAVDDPDNASAYSGAVVVRPPFTVAISSSGATPALSRLLREIIEELLPGEAWVEHAKRLRAAWRAEGTPMGDRFGELVKAFKRSAE